MGATYKDIIHVDDYPELALLAWNRAVRDIGGADAFGLYEAYWRFVDQERMPDNEKKLLDRLTKAYEKG